MLGSSIYYRYEIYTTVFAVSYTAADYQTSIYVTLYGMAKYTERTTVHVPV